MNGFRLKRVYEPPSDKDGYRVLTDRLWPRGQRKDEVKLDEWNKDIAPSAALRKWFNHQPERFEAFATQYRAELESKTDHLQRLRNIARTKPVTLLYAAKDEHNNQAVVLRQVLQS